MKPHPTYIALAAGMLLSGCLIPVQQAQPVDIKSATPPGPAPAVEGKLYARDGTPVDTGPKGSMRVEAEPKREIGEAEGSRASLLELYTNAVAEKNALTEEVLNLRVALDMERHNVAVGIDERTVLRTEMTKLIRERDAAKTESMDLAARLTTAQIARLETQKQLLEIQIEARQREETAAIIQGASQPSPKDKRRSPGDH